MKTKKINFNNTQIEMYEHNNKLFMQPDHNYCYNLGSLDRMILSGTEKELFVYFPGRETEELEYSGWMPNLEHQIEIGHNYQVFELELVDDEDPNSAVIRTPMTVQNATESIALLEDVLYPQFLTELELEQIYATMDRYVLDRGWSGRRAGNIIYCEMKANKDVYNSAPAPVKRPEPSRETDSMDLEQLASMFGIQI